MQSAQLENDYVKLKPMKMEDVEDIFAVACYSEIWAHMSITINNRDDVVNYVTTALKLKESGTEYPFVILDAKTNQIIGATKLMDISKSHKRGEIGFTWLTPSYWRTAINTNCKFLLLQYCLEHLKWQRVQLKTDHENKQSQKALERIGATFEGILRNHMIRKDGTTRHTFMYSVTSEDWPKVKKHLTKLMN